MSVGLCLGSLAINSIGSNITSNRVCAAPRAIRIIRLRPPRPSHRPSLGPQQAEKGKEEKEESRGTN